MTELADLGHLTPGAVVALARLAITPEGAGFSATTLRAVIRGMVAMLDDSASKAVPPIDWHAQLDALGRPVDMAGQLVTSAQPTDDDARRAWAHRHDARQALSDARGAPERCAVCGHPVGEHRPSGGECLANSATCSCPAFTSPRAEP